MAQPPTSLASVAVRWLPEPVWRQVWSVVGKYCRRRGWPHRVVRSLDACRTLPGIERWIEVRPAASLELAFREHRSGRWSTVRRRAHLEAQGVLIVHAATVAGAEGWPATAEGALPLGVFHRARRVPRSLWERQPDLTERMLPGTSLNLGAPWAHVNFGHALVDVLPRLATALDAGVTSGSCDHVLVPDTRADGYLRAALAGSGFRESQIIRLEPGVLHRCDRLLQPSHPAFGSMYPAWLRDAFRRFLPIDAAGSETGLWIERSSGNRRILEAERLERTARSLGVQRFAPGTWDEDVRAFSRARLVAGPHDATLACLWFSPAGVRVLELCPPAFADDFYASAVAAAGGTYVRIVGRPPQCARGRYADFSVDPELVEATLLDLLRGATPG